MKGQSFLFDTQDRFDSIFNEARLRIIILQVSIIGIIALGVTQVIISGGIDLSSGPLVGATAMIVMSFAQTELVNGNPNHEYAAITGDAEFVKLSLEFAYGPDSAPLVENRVAAAQVLSGTGGLRVCAQLIERLPRLTNSSIKPVCYMPEPTWGNHPTIFQKAGLTPWRRDDVVSPKTGIIVVILGVPY